MFLVKSYICENSPVRHGFVSCSPAAATLLCKLNVKRSKYTIDLQWVGWVLTAPSLTVQVVWLFEHGDSLQSHELCYNVRITCWVYLRSNNLMEPYSRTHWPVVLIICKLGYTVCEHRGHDLMSYFCLFVPCLLAVHVTSFFVSLRTRHRCQVSFSDGWRHRQWQLPAIVSPECLRSFKWVWCTWKK